MSLRSVRAYVPQVRQTSVERPRTSVSLGTGSIGLSTGAPAVAAVA
jgi:hypothetical protein